MALALESSCETQFLFLLAANGVQSQLSPVESHHSAGTVERAHHPLRLVFQKIRKAHNDLDPALALALARKAMNVAAGPAGFPPTLLVFGELPRAKHLGLERELRPQPSPGRG